MAVVSIKNKLRRGNLLVGNEAYDPAGFDSIATVTVNSGGASTVTFSSIPSTYTHLQIRASVQTNRGTYATDSYYLQFNNDTGSNYNYGWVRGNGSSAAAYHYPSAQTMAYIESASGSTVSPTAFGAAVIDILDYKDTNKYKTIRTLSGTDINGTVAGYGGFVYLSGGLWMSTSAITSIKITGDNTFQNYTTFALYGIKSA
jgi:hypothetical protein